MNDIEANIQRVIADKRLQLLKKVVDNCVFSRTNYNIKISKIFI